MICCWGKRPGAMCCNACTRTPSGKAGRRAKTRPARWPKRRPARRPTSPVWARPPPIPPRPLPARRKPASPRGLPLWAFGNNRHSYCTKAVAGRRPATAGPDVGEHGHRLARAWNITVIQSCEGVSKLVSCGTNTFPVYACQGSSDPGVARKNRGSADPLQAELTGAGLLPRCTRFMRLSKG